MSEQSPYSRLGVTENASFEEIQEAKTRLSQQHRDDSQALENIEAAYDAIIMDRLRMRQEGKIKVPDRIRFAEKATEVPPNFPPLTPKSSPAWLQRLIDNPSKMDLLQSSGVFLALVAITILVPAGPQSIVPLLLVLGIFATFYFINRKEQRFGRALLLSFVGLVVGVILGGVFVNFLGGIIGLAPDQITCLVTFILFWFISSFLR